MKKMTGSSIILILSFLMLFMSGSSLAGSDTNSRTIAFDSDWKFLKGNPSNAQSPNFDDSKWRTLDLPHDWSIEDLSGQSPDSIIGPFSKSSVGKMCTGYTVGGIAWYRKNFTSDKLEKGKTVYLQFDGIYMNSDVWINGKHVGNHPYGYTSFYYDISSFLNPVGQTNTVAVRVRNEGKNTRWYSGSGIYRHVWLTMVNPVHIPIWGLNVSTTSTENLAEIMISTTLKNLTPKDASVILQIQLFDPSGKLVGTSKSNSTLRANESSEVIQKIELGKPTLWSIENPALYQAKVSVISNQKELDQVSTSFGIRTIHFDAQSGFTLNGKTVKMKGGCFHHDNGPLGSAAIDRAEERKIELLKKAGFNAIRCSHNPPSPYLLDVCDRLGMLVIDEAFDMWEKPKNDNDYSLYFKDNWKKDLQSVILRDRNHPSVIMWSIGNEIPEAPDSIGFKTGKNLAAEVRKLDKTRAVTQGLNDFGGFNAKISDWVKMGKLITELDVVGYNYAYQQYEKHHEQYPNRIMYASEFMPPLSLQNWQMVEKHPYVIGNFSWTAMDYLGEAGVGIPRLIIDTKKDPNDSTKVEDMMQFFKDDTWPMFGNFQGDIDLIGNPKTPYYYQHVVWRDSKIEMFVHTPIPAGMKEIQSPWGFPDELKSWNWKGHEGEKLQVHVYTRSDLVKLELNGKLIGEQSVDDNNSITATFNVPYEPGTLIAHCYDNGIETASETIKTVGKPAALRLIYDRNRIKADRNDLSYIITEIVDLEGNTIPNADGIVVNYEISGNGEIAGVGNGNPIDLGSFQQPRKTSYQGRCLAIVRPKGKAGKINLKATSYGLKESSVEIISE
jgi:beta-galactosidase